MTINTMRHILITKSPYTSKSWQHKVNNMQSSQVIAVYTSFLSRNLLK